MRGRQAKTNLYHIGFDEKHLDQGTVGGLRDQLGLHMSPTPPALRDVALFSFWSVLAIGSWCPLPLSRSRFLADRSRTLVVKSQPQYL
jgi:hypothetical protein